MSQGEFYAGLWGCLCGRTSCPRRFHSVQDLKKNLGGACRLLDGGLEPVNMIVPEFFSPVATTSGATSVLSERGRFGPIQFANMHFRCRRGEIALRTSRQTPAFEDKCLVAISDLDEGERRPPAMHIFSDTGRIVHRIDLTHADDGLVLASACSIAATWDGPVAFLGNENRRSSCADNVISLLPYLEARQNWHGRTLEDHLDEVICDGGRTRLRTLRQLPNNSAWEIDRPVLPAFLNHLANQKVDCTRIVPQPTLLQASCGPLDSLRLRQNLALLYSGDAIMAIDLSSIAQCWAVVYGDAGDPVIALELYDRDDMCVALLLTEQSADQAARLKWHGMILALPRL